MAPYRPCVAPWGQDGRVDWLGDVAPSTSAKSAGKRFSSQIQSARPGLLRPRVAVCARSWGAAAARSPQPRARARLPAQRAARMRSCRRWWRASTAATARGRVPGARACWMEQILRARGSSAREAPKPVACASADRSSAAPPCPSFPAACLRSSSCSTFHGRLLSGQPWLCCREARRRAALAG